MEKQSDYSKLLLLLDVGSEPRALNHPSTDSNESPCISLGPNTVFYFDRNGAFIKVVFQENNQPPLTFNVRRAVQP